MMGENEALVLNIIKDNTVHTEKQSNIDFRRPIALMSHPDKKPPVNPPMPNIIMLRPRSFCASPLPINVCIQVGIHEKIAHMPISIEPKITEPVIKFARWLMSKILSLVEC